MSVGGKEMKANTKNIVNYVNQQLDRTRCNNIAINLPGLNKNTFNALANHFKEVRRQPFGYIRFER